MERVLKALTREQYDRYHADGGVAPVAALSREEAAHYRACLENFDPAGIPVRATVGAQMK